MNIVHHWAYLRVHSRAVASYFERSALYRLAISGTKGSSGLGSVNKELMERRTMKWGLFLTFADCEGRWPLIFEDVQADGSILVDVGVVDPGNEVNLGWFEGVVGGEVDVQEEHTTAVWGVIGSHDCSLPVELVLLIDRSSWAVGGWVLAKINKFLLNSLEGHLAFVFFFDFYFNILFKLQRSFKASKKWISKFLI